MLPFWALFHDVLLEDDDVLVHDEDELAFIDCGVAVSVAHVVDDTIATSTTAVVD